jgi:hypothetical protein
MAMGLLKQVLQVLKQESRSRTPSRVNQWFKWLAPGLLVKRWMLISAAGVLLVTLGLAIWSNLTPVFYISQILGDLLRSVTQLIPSYISGPLVLLAGILFVFWGQTRSLGAITEVLMPEGNEELVDRLMTHRRLHRGPKIVVLGGGTGLSTLLRGLKRYSANITAIVTVADDGGSSGRLRREIGVLPPGDVRNCLAALADEEKLSGTQLRQPVFDRHERDYGRPGASDRRQFQSPGNSWGSAARYPQRYAPLGRPG